MKIHARNAAVPPVTPGKPVEPIEPVKSEDEAEGSADGKQPFMMVPPMHAEGSIVLPHRPHDEKLHNVPHMIVKSTGPEHAYSAVPHCDGMTLEDAKAKHAEGEGVKLMESEARRADAESEARKAEGEAKTAAKMAMQRAAVAEQEALEMALESKGIKADSAQGKQLQTLVRATMQPGQSIKAAVEACMKANPLAFLTGTAPAKGEERRATTTPPPANMNMGKQPRSFASLTQEEREARYELRDNISNAKR